MSVLTPAATPTVPPAGPHLIRARTIRTVRVLAGSSDASAPLRTATYLGQDYLIVPVVAMVGDAVIRPLGSRGPEYVPSYVLAAAPQGWNNRPCTLDHPASGTQSANDPVTLERYCFGHVFNARYEDGRLKLEAWLSRARAEAVGPEAVRFIERCEAGEMAEVSIGAYVGVEQRAGIAANGEAYEYVWTDLAASDHLAMLPEGAVGACSVDNHGCGTNRVARAAGGTNMADGKLKVDISGGRTLRQAIEWLGSMIGIGQRTAAEEEGLSDSELRGRLWDALYATEPAFGGIVDIYPDSSVVIYTTSPEGNYSWWRRSFTLGDGAAVSINDAREEVKPVMTYETVAAMAAATGAPGGTATEPRAACACQHAHSGDDTKSNTNVHAGEGQAAPSPVHNEGEPMTDKKKALIGRLTANTRVPIPEATLQTLTEEQLEEMAGLYEQRPSSPNEPPKQEAVPSTPPAPPVNARTITEDEYQTLRRAAAVLDAQERTRKAAIIGQLKAAQSAYTEADLNTKPIEELEKLASALGVDRVPSTPDYSGRGLAYTPTTAHDAAIQRALNPPDPYGLNLNKANGKEAN